MSDIEENSPAPDDCESDKEDSDGPPEEEEEVSETGEEKDDDEEEDEDDKGEDSDGPPSENVQMSTEYMELEVPEMIDEKKKLLEEFERRKRARLITVPTDDTEVKGILREKGEPICLFGEGPADRRNRLKNVLSLLQEKPEDEAVSDDESVDSSQADAKETKRDDTWYHRGPPSLKEARMFMVNYSVPRARGRLKREKSDKDIPITTKKAHKQELQVKLRSFGLVGSQNADTRPISYCSFSPNGAMLATSSWSGLSKIWHIPDCSEKICLTAHNSFVDCIEWHPGSTTTVDSSSLNLVSSGRDGRVYLWNLVKQDPIDSLPKMEGRISRVKFHPSGRFIGSCVHDNSWRLWDIQAREEILFQEGHSKAVYCIGFQKDGALAATGGLDAFGRAWDLRTGRCVMFLSGHSGSIFSIDWSTNGYHLATGSEDNTVRVWDIRCRKSMYTIPAHTSLVSSVSYDPQAGQYLVTTSYDGSVKLWCHRSFQLLKAFEGNGQKIMSNDISPDGNMIASCSFDRTFKLWAPE